MRFNLLVGNPSGLEKPRPWETVEQRGRNPADAPQGAPADHSSGPQVPCAPTLDERSA
jgi:hypothetical protein